MFPVDGILLTGGLLLLFAIASSKFSSRLGVPVLVLFLAIGMLAGSEGIGGIAFDDYGLAHGIATAALAIILFDGGLRTPSASFRLALAPSVVLATAGVVGTALITGLAASWIVGLPTLEGILLGSIVGSTDAAAVFATLRGRGLRLPDRLAATLEIESGSNDPMAIFLTVGILEILFGRMEPGVGLAGFLVVQAVVGGAVGVGMGRAAVALNNRINLDAAGLYPILMGATGLLAYGLAAALGGSGFLSVYLAGIILGNSRIVFRRGIFLFMDAMAWLAQITMFIVLGLLVFPSRLVEVAAEGLLIAAALLLIARPLVVLALAAPFRFSTREVAFLSWAGLKGAVPIILATYPLLFGLPSGPLLFNVVFFVVLVSALSQGWSLPALARRLGLQRPAEPEAPVALEITSLKHVKGDIVEYVVGPESRAAGRTVRELALPDGAVIAMIARDEEVIAPRGSTRIEPGDYAFLMVRPEVRPLVDRAFGRGRPSGLDALPAVEFSLMGTATVGDLEEFYGLRIDAPPDRTLDAVIRERLGDDTPRPGQRIAVGEFTLAVREVGAAGIERVGLEITSATGPTAEARSSTARRRPRP